MTLRPLAGLLAAAVLAFSIGCATNPTPPPGGPSSGTPPGPSTTVGGSHELQSDDILQSYLDPHRDESQKPDEVIRRMGLKPAQTIADIGAGSGYFTVRFSKAVGPGGKVIAVDVDPHALDFLKKQLQKQPPPFPNIETVVSTFNDVKLPPASIDWAFMCEAHFFVESDPASTACLQSIRRALKPGGRLAIIEAKDDPRRGPVPLDRLQANLLKTGFALDRVEDMYDREYFVIMK